MKRRCLTIISLLLLPLSLLAYDLRRNRLPSLQTKRQKETSKISASLSPRFHWNPSLLLPVEKRKSKEINQTSSEELLVKVTIYERKTALLSVSSGSKDYLLCPVRFGRENEPLFRTPRGKGYIVGFELNPWWTPGPTAKREALLEGKILPAKVSPYLGNESYPPNPNNAMGVCKFRLKGRYPDGKPWPSDFLIHGTNRPWEVGESRSLSCLGLLNKDALKLLEVIKPVLSTKGKVPLIICDETESEEVAG